MTLKKTIKERDELWREYKKTKNIEIRDKLILEYIGLIKYIAGRVSIYLGANVEYEELYSYGIFGLIDAIDKFDLSKGVKFETYASLRIRGAIIDNIRAADWVPRSVRQKHKDLERAYNSLENELGRSATDEEIASKMNLSIKEFHKLLSDVNVDNTISLEDYIEKNFEGNFDIADDNIYGKPDKQAELGELSNILADALSILPEKEKIVLSLYYYEELTLKEISKVLEVTESRISQLHTKALMRLKGKLTRYKSSIKEV